MSELIKIIVASHKEYRMPADKMYLPVQVGAAGKNSVGFQRDDEGENISGLNPFFCELTGLYWGWKNVEADFLGLVHYRRHFSLHPHSKDLWDAVLKQNEIETDLKTVKIFVPQKRWYYIETLYSHYAHTHDIEHLDQTRDIIARKYPEYVQAFDQSVNRRWGYMFNIMIMRHDFLNEYCEWLFDILFELKERFGEEGLSPYEARYCGRVSEIAFNVWLTANMETGRIRKSEIKELSLIQMEKINWLDKGSAFLKAKFLQKKYTRNY